MDTLRTYLEARNLSADWAAIAHASTERLVNSLAAISPYGPEEKQALLDDLQEQVEQTVLTKFGAGAYQSYKARGGRWINSLGRL